MKMNLAAPDKTMPPLDPKPIENPKPEPQKQPENPQPRYK